MSKYVNFNTIPTGQMTDTSFFSRIKNAGAKLGSTTIIIIVSIILFLIIAIFYYFYYVAPKFKTKYQHNREGGSDSGSINGNSKTAELLLFYAEWCPHCKTAKPIWDDLKSEYQNKTINGYKVIFTEINCTTESAEVEEMMNKYNVEGFPTIKLLKDGQIIEYDAKPSKATLTQFLNTVL